MSTKGRDISVRRILLPLDSSDLNRRTIELAADMAGAFEAELVGVFVKEANLLNLAELPFARIIDRRSGERRALSRGGMERALDALSERARNALIEAAQRKRVSFSFQVKTGEPLEAAVEMAAQFDIVAVSGQLCASARAVLASKTRGHEIAPGRTLFLVERDMAPERPVLALYEGNLAVLAAAVRLAATLGAPLQILAVAETDDLAKRRQRNARAWLARRRNAATVGATTASIPSDLLDVLRQSTPAAAVIERQAGLSGQILELDDLSGLKIPLLVLG